MQEHVLVNLDPLSIQQREDYDQTLSITRKDATQQNSYFVLVCGDKVVTIHLSPTLWLTVTTEGAGQFKTGTERRNVNMNTSDSFRISSESHRYDESY